MPATDALTHLLSPDVPMCLQVNNYLKVWKMIKVMPDLGSLFIDKTHQEEASETPKWTADSTSKIAALRKLMRKRKGSVLLEPDFEC